MSIAPLPFVVHRNGRPATAEELAPLAFAGFAHFTAMQVRGGQVRGLDLHLDRLRSASMHLFKRALPDDQVRTYLRAALEGGPADLSLVATVHAPEGEFTPDGGHMPEMLVRTGPPSSGPAGPLTLATVDYERVLPSIKHVGEVAKTYFLRQAVGQGFDDAVFIDRRGQISEGSIWNVAFWDGRAVIWPQADMLIGTMMGIVRRQLERLGIPQIVCPVTRADLSAFGGAVVMNSWTPGIAVQRIDSISLPDASFFLDLLHQAYNAEPFSVP